MKKVVSLVLIAIMVLLMVACGNNSNEVAEMTDTANNQQVNEPANDTTGEATDEDAVAYEPVTFTDGMGIEIEISEEPMRIISLAPSMTEMIYALDLGDRLVGRTDYCNYPEAALAVESIGSLREPNVEGIIALNPDLVLMSTHASEEAHAKFEAAGIKVAVLTAQESFDGVYQLLEQMGTIFHVEEKAQAIIEDMQADVKDVMDKVAGVEKKTVYYVVGFGEYGDFTATGDTFIHEMLEMAGGENIAADGEGWSYNLETIIEKDPEYILCSELYDTKGQLEATEGYQDLTAVKEGRLVAINQDLLSRQGPRLAEGLKVIAQVLHPELFE